METQSKKPRKDQEFRDLCDYIKDEIMEYGNEMKLTKQMVLRIKGLAEGKFIANRKTKPLANYSFKVILYTFKICKSKILSAFHGKAFQSEMNKFNYGMAIIESEINDVAIRLNNVEKSKEKVENMKLDNMDNESAEYKAKTKDSNTRLSDLW
jgi:hypothetical protein